VPAPPAGLTAQFHLQQRMVAGIRTTYEAFNHVQELRAALAKRTTDAAGHPPAALIVTAAQALDAALTQLASGPAGLGAAHRDLARRLNDQLVGDIQPTASVIAGVDGPCHAIDAALDGLRRLETTTVVELSAMLTRAGLMALPAWTPPAGPACEGTHP
jgi:hypothetical protein